jgi:hypothetical protein
MEEIVGKIKCLRFPCPENRFLYFVGADEEAMCNDALLLDGVHRREIGQSLRV